MTGNDRRAPFAPAALLPAAVALGLVVLVWAATTGPVGIAGPSGRTVKFGSSASPTAPTDSASPGENLREATRNVQQKLDLSWLGDLITSAILVGVGLGLFLVVRALWVRRWRAPERPAEVDFDVLPTGAVADALRGDFAAQLAAIEAGSARNGIVQCWLRLEEVVTAAGLPPRRSETSAEFTVRVLKALDVDPRAIGTLAGLYREARFSEHDLDEQARQSARAALEELHDDLRTRGVTS